MLKQAIELSLERLLKGRAMLTIQADPRMVMRNGIFYPLSTPSYHLCFTLSDAIHETY